jgi:thiamine-phosphate pyrophosphorylase
LNSSPFRTKAEKMDAFSNIDIYPVISSEFTNGRDVLDVLRQIAEGGAGIVQLREKNKTKAEVYRLALEYRKITAQFNMLLILNDHLDIAMAAGADGVHLGQDDLPLEPAKKLGYNLIIGNSTHNLEEALAARAAGADYINIGPIYPTGTKAVACGAIGLETMKTIAARVNMPFTVMGGIKARHIPGLLACGAGKIAMVTEITQAEDIRTRTAELRSLFIRKGK